MEVWSNLQSLRHWGLRVCNPPERRWVPEQQKVSTLSLILWIMNRTHVAWSRHELMRFGSTSRLCEEGTSSSIFLPVKISVAVKWHLAWPCLPVLEVVTSITWEKKQGSEKLGPCEPTAWLYQLPRDSENCLLEFQLRIDKVVSFRATKNTPSDGREGFRA